MSSMNCPTVLINSTHKPSQGDWVMINACDFDPAKGHVLYELGKLEAVEVLGVNLSLSVEDDLTGIKRSIVRKFKKSTEGEKS